MTVQSVLMSGVVVLAVVFPGDWGNRAVRVAGLAALVAGAAFGISGALALKGNRTIFPQPKPHSQLVQRGIYARVRHPLYTSVMLVSLGWALLWQSVPALVTAIALMPFLVAKAQKEEGWLRQKFPDYADYEKRVPRFVPHLRARRP